MTQSHPSIQEFMTPEPITTTSNTPLSEAAHLMRGRAIRHLPVVDDGKLVGVISERDITVARTLKHTSLDRAPVSMVMSEPPIAVPPDAPVSDVCARMIDRKAGSAIVVFDGRVVGIFTSHDALHALHQILGVQG